LVAASPASAGWSSTGTGNGAASARSLPAGNTPSASAGLGSVTVTWSQSSFAGGGPVPSYVVRRFNALSGVEGAVGAACSGLVSSTSCVESGVPTGSWKYSVTPAAGVWRGGQSAQGNTIVVLI
jgi:hypothetical protein